MKVFPAVVLPVFFIVFLSSCSEELIENPFPKQIDANLQYEKTKTFVDRTRYLIHSGDSLGLEQYYVSTLVEGDLPVLVTRQGDVIASSVCSLRGKNLFRTIVIDGGTWLNRLKNEFGSMGNANLRFANESYMYGINIIPIADLDIYLVGFQPYGPVHPRNLFSL